MVVQQVKTETGESATGTTAIPDDDSIPQITEGDEYMTVAITPTKSSNILMIDVVTFSGHSAVTTITSALFQNAGTDAIATGQAYNGPAAGVLRTNSFTHYMAAGTTSEATFRVRIGGNTGSTTTFNGHTGARKMGGAMASSVTVTEIGLGSGGVGGLALGDWQTRTNDTVYQASTDGFLLGMGHGTAGGNCVVYAYSDGNNPPTTVVCRNTTHPYGASVGYSTVFVPVKKGNYWKVDGCAGVNALVSWIPLVNASVTSVPVGSVVQVVNTQDGALDLSNTAIPWNDDIPQIAEGKEWKTLSITPNNASNKLKIDVSVMIAPEAGGDRVQVALFNTDVHATNALACQSTAVGTGIGNYPHSLSFSYFMDAETTSETTFRVRHGCHDTSDCTINGGSGSRLFGGVAISSITITEIQQ